MSIPHRRKGRLEHVRRAWGHRREEKLAPYRKSRLRAVCGYAVAQDTHRPVVRIAELEIDPAWLESYKAVVREEMETPGIAVHASRVLLRLVQRHVGPHAEASRKADNTLKASGFIPVLAPRNAHPSLGSPRTCPGAARRVPSHPCRGRRSQPSRRVRVRSRRL